MMATGKALVWHVLRVAPQSEFRVESALNHCGLVCFIPVEFKWRKRRPNSRVKVKRPYPIFVRYAFVGLSGDKDWSHIQHLKERGMVMGPLTFDRVGGVPARLTPADIVDLASRSESPVPYVQSVNPHKAALSPQVGGQALIVDGPLAGRTGYVELIVANRAHLLLKLFNSARTVPIPLADLEAA